MPLSANRRTSTIITVRTSNAPLRRGQYRGGICCALLGLAQTGQGVTVMLFYFHFFMRVCVPFVLLGLNIQQPRADEEDPLFRVTRVETSAGFEIGRGYDVLTGKPRADCVDRSVVEKHPEFGPSSVSFRSIRIENSEQLDKALGISASASVNAGYASAGGSASFSNSLLVNSYALSYLVEVAVTGRGNSIRDVKLKEPYQKLISSGNNLAI